MTVSARTALAGLMGTLIWATAVSAARPLDIETTFHNSVDIAGFRTCHWGEGEPSENRQLEEAVRVQVREILSNKGYRIVSAPGDCVVRTLSRTDDYFPSGVFLVEVFDRESAQLAWRARISGLLNPADRGRTLRVFHRSIKKAFKTFPKARNR